MQTAFLVMLLGLCAGTEGGDTLVKTKYGMIQGHTVTLHTGTIVNSFLGVPYAKPPLGNLRFRPPEEVQPWNDTFVADTLGSACPQDFLGVLWLTHPGWLDFGEDCLTMNIYAPNNTKTKGPHPVMMWIHGGAFRSSANVQYPGHFLAAKDVIVVVINYRLGGLGFMSTGDSASPGNYGLMDQVLALEFIRDNIAAFGGDPKKVTIFGQSAGGASVSLMQYNQRAKGLYHQLIAHSGTDLALWAVNEGDHPDYTRQKARKVNCTTENTQDMIDCMRTRPADDIIGDVICVPGYFCLGHAPVVDGPGGVLPEHPRDLRMKGRYTKVPSISGQTSEDGSIYLALFDPKAWFEGYTQKEFEDYLIFAVEYFAPRFPNLDKEGLYQALKFYYSNWPHRNNTGGNRDRLTEIITDLAWGLPGDIATKCNINGSDAVPTYNYVFGYRSANASDILPDWMGVPHMLDLPYVLGLPLLNLNDDVRYDSGIWFDVIDWNKEDIEYADFVLTLWTNFAKYGKPTPEPVPSPFSKKPITWKQFTKTNYHFLELYRAVQLKQDYRQRDLAFWSSYLNWMVFRGDSGKE